jgi:hypothetical protein
MRPCWFLPALALLACKAESDQATRPLPAPEPPSTTKAELTPVAATPEPRKDRPAREIKENAEPAVPSDSNPEKATTATPTATASAAAAPDKSCQQACQAGLQTCLSQQPSDPDGGTSMEGLANCKKALDECKSRCSP